MEKNNANQSAMGIASLVLGIISILTALFWYLTLPTGILAIVFGVYYGLWLIAILFGVKSIHKVGSKLGKAGMVTGIVGLSVFVFIYLSLILILALANL